MALDKRKDVQNIDSYIWHLRSFSQFLIPMKSPITVSTNYQIWSDLAMLGYDYFYFAYCGFFELYAPRFSLVT